MGLLCAIHVRVHVAVFNEFVIVNLGLELLLRDEKIVDSVVFPRPRGPSGIRYAKPKPVGVLAY